MPPKKRKPMGVSKLQLVDPFVPIKDKTEGKRVRLLNEEKNSQRAKSNTDIKEEQGFNLQFCGSEILNTINEEFRKRIASGNTSDASLAKFHERALAQYSKGIELRAEAAEERLKKQRELQEGSMNAGLTDGDMKLLKEVLKLHECAG